MILLAAAALTALDPLSFFTGPSHGVGTIKIILKGVQPIHVTSRGRPDGHGGMYLDQDVIEGSKPSQARHWYLRPTSATTLAGSLAPDASGPVTGSLSEQTLTLSYPMKGGMTATQTLIVQPGGRVLLNHMIVKKFGLTVATIEERISKD